MKKIFHPYSLALFVGFVSLAILIYVGLKAPTADQAPQEVKGAATESANYVIEKMKEYGTDLAVNDTSYLQDSELISQRELTFAAFSEATVTYDLFRFRNKTGEPLTLRITPQKANSANLENLDVRLKVNGGEFELYDHSQKPNEDLFAITLDPYQTLESQLVVTSDQMPSDKNFSSVIIQVSEY